MYHYAGTGIHCDTGAAKMAESPVKSSDTSESSSIDEDDEVTAVKASLVTILDANSRPSTAIRPEAMDWSDNLCGLDPLLSVSPGSHSKPACRDQPTEGSVQAVTASSSPANPAATTKNADTASLSFSHPREGRDDSETKTDKLIEDSSDKQTSKGLSEESSIENKAKAYIKRKKNEQMAAIRSSLGDKLLTYDAINTANRRKMAASYLQSEAGRLDEGCGDGGDFLSNGDGRSAKMCLKVNLLRKMTVSFSFDPVSKTCSLCPMRMHHPVLGSPAADSRGIADREVIVLGDQAMPPLLPSSSEQNCVRLIRIEFGSIPDLVKILLELLEGRKLSPGSIILIFSASHISNVGLAAYIEDMVEAVVTLKSALGRDILVSTAPPLLLCGTEREEVIRDIFDLFEWVNSAAEEEDVLRVSNDEALCSIMENGHRGSQLEHRSRIRLPVSMSSLAPKKTWSTGGNTSLPCATSPATETQERTVMVALIQEIKTKLAINLDEEPVTSRKLTATPTGGAQNFLVVGSSNARRLTAALKAKGVPAGSVLCSGWRATKQSVAELTEHVKAELAASSYTAVIYFLLDNNLFFAVNEEGGHGPATRDSEGQFHVVGDLVVADPAAQQAVMKLCAPLWEAASSTNMVVVSPLPRYVKHSCCPDAGHIPNRTDPAFYYTLKEELAACATTIKNFLFISGMRYGRVMDPQRNIKGLTIADIWDKDPVHPKEEIYAKIAEGVLEVERSCGGGGGSGKRKAASYGPEEGGSQAHRPVRGRLGERGSHGHNYTNYSPGLPGSRYGRREGSDHSASPQPGSNTGWGTRRGRGEGRWRDRGGRITHSHSPFGGSGRGGGGHDSRRGHGGRYGGGGGGGGRGGRGGQFSRGGWQ